MTRKIQAILFDCDGVLIDTEAIANKLFHERLVAWGVEITPEEALQTFKGLATRKCVDWVNKNKGVQLGDKFITEFRTMVREAIAKDAPLVPGVLDLIKYLQSIAFPFAVASSTSKETLDLNLKNKGLYPFFEGRIFSCSQIQKYKPEPDVYLWAADEIETPIENCLIIEDSFYGLQAGLASGAKVLHYNPHGENFDLIVEEIKLMKSVIDHLQ